MPDEPQRCVCSHPFSIHRLNPVIGNRNECWAVKAGHGVSAPPWCGCRNFVPAGQPTGDGPDVR